MFYAFIEQIIFECKDKFASVLCNGNRVRNLADRVIKLLGLSDRKKRKYMIL